MEKATHAPVVEVDSDEEAKMDIPPPSPIDAPSPPPLTVGTCSSSTLPNWYQNLSQHLDTISLDIQQLRQDHQDDIRSLSEEQDQRLCTLFEEQDCRFREIMAQQAELAQFMQSQYHPPPQ